MTPFEFLILALATWRISALLTKEAGPFHVFEKLRELVGIQHDEDGNVSIIPNKVLAELLSCVWCSSIWVALGWTIFWLLAPMVCITIALLFALSTMAILIDHVL